MEYIVSDYHFSHENIIDYCDRPFETVEEMDRECKENWNSIVSPKDTVYYLGDFIPFEEDATRVQSVADELNGSLLFISGNHDEFDETRVSFPVVSSFEFTRGKYTFYCTHREATAPESADWVIHGHHHNKVTKYPFINTQQNRIHVSAEVIGFTPLPVPQLCEVLNKTKQIRHKYTKHLED